MRNTERIINAIRKKETNKKRREIRNNTKKEKREEEQLQDWFVKITKEETK